MMPGMAARDAHSEWTFLTNHARVLLAISRDPGARLREVALNCGVTERTDLWEMMVAVFPTYARYQAMVRREIPVVALTRTA